MATPNEYPPPPTAQPLIEVNGKLVTWQWADWFARLAKRLAASIGEDSQNALAAKIFAQHPVPGIPGVEQLSLDDSRVVQIGRTFQPHHHYTIPADEAERVLAGQIFGY